MKIQTRILILLVLLVGAFTGVLLFLRSTEYKRLELIKIQQQQEKEGVFEQIIKMRAASSEGMVKDYTLWNEMVTFVTTGDKEWAKSNIDGGLTSFNVDVFWIYSLQNQLIHSLNTFDRPVNLGGAIAPLNVANVFHDQLFPHFFITTDVGVMEIHGSTINYVVDAERKQPQGYMLVGRAWDLDRMHDLAKITGTRIDLVMDGKSQIPITSGRRDIGTISFVYVLEGIDKQPVARLFVSFNSSMLSRSDKISKTFSLLFFLSMMVFLSLVAVTFIFWISLPLRKISLALEREDARHISSLEQSPGEMGDIARLIQGFFVQKQALSIEILERKQAEEQLQAAYKDLQSIQTQLFQSEKMSSIGQMAAGVAHEINNPVGFISNNMAILKEYIQNYKKILQAVEALKGQVDSGNLPQAKLIVEELKNLEKEVNFEFMTGDVTSPLDESVRWLERIRKIVLNLRTFARADNAEIDEFAKIEEVIEGILNIVQSEFKSKVELIKDYGDTPRIPCSLQKLGQVFINLLINATQSIEGTGKVRIRTYRQDPFVCVDITDTGKGIPAENLNKVFEPFFTTKPVGQGTGLGLSICYDIVKKHGGEIKVHSKVGEGTTFIVCLPVNKLT